MPLAFAIPIEHRPSGNSFTAGGDTQAMASGVYACIATLLYEFRDNLQLCTGLGSATVSINSNDKVVISNGSTFSLTWVDTDLRDILGFEGDLSGASSYTAGLTPQYTWLAEYIRAERNAFELKHDEQFKGARSMNGTVAGTYTGTETYYTEFNLQDEYGYKLHKSECRSDNEQDRCFDNILVLSRAQYPDSGNVSPSGAYLFPDKTDIQPIEEMDSGDCSKFNYTSDPDVYAFGYFPPNEMPEYKAGVPNSRSYYDLEYEWHSANAPTWDV